jgi:hypothetical protein
MRLPPDEEDGDVGDDDREEEEDAVKIAGALGGEGEDQLGDDQRDDHDHQDRPAAEEKHVAEGLGEGVVEGQVLAVVGQPDKGGGAADLVVEEAGGDGDDEGDEGEDGQEEERRGEEGVEGEALAERQGPHRAETRERFHCGSESRGRADRDGLDGPVIGVVTLLWVIGGL